MKIKTKYKHHGGPTYQCHKCCVTVELKLSQINQDLDHACGVHKHKTSPMSSEF